jgi:hypothetical protein
MSIKRYAPLLGAVAFGSLWAVLASISPTTTYHLAPLIVAAWPPIADRSGRKPLPMAVAGFAIAVALTALLALAGALEGGSLMPWGDAAAESFAAAAVGGAVGYLVALGRQRIVHAV